MNASRFILALWIVQLHCFAAEVRVRNASNVDLKDVRIEDRYYRHIKAGETTYYYHIAHAFTDITASATVGGVELHLVPGIFPRLELADGKYTFTLTVADGALSGSETTDELVAPAPKAPPVIQANPLTPRTFDCNFSLREMAKENQTRFSGKSSWHLFNNEWRQRLEGPRYMGMEVVNGENMFKISGPDKVNDRSGIVIFSEKDPSLEVFIPDTGTPEPSVYYRQGKGNWRVLGRMEHVK